MSIKEILSTNEGIFLEQFDLSNIFKNTEEKECLEWVKENLYGICNYKTGQELLGTEPFMHCRSCIKNVLNQNAFAAFMSIKLRNYLLDNLSHNVNYSDYDSNTLKFRKLEETTAKISMKKINRKARIIDEGVEIFRNLYHTNSFPSDELQINDNESYNLVCNQSLIEIENFPFNFKRMAKIFYEKGIDPVKRERNCESKVKILTAMFATQIDYGNSLYFGRELNQVYKKLIPMQLEYHFEKFGKNNFDGKFNKRCRKSFEFLETIDNVSFGCGTITRKIIHIWLATKYYDTMGMKGAMDYMREFANFDMMINDLTTEDTILKVLSKNLTKRNLLENNLTLDQQLDIFESKLIAHSKYVRFQINYTIDLESNYYHN